MYKTIINRKECEQVNIKYATGTIILYFQLNPSGYIMNVFTEVWDFYLMGICMTFVRQKYRDLLEQSNNLKTYFGDLVEIVEKK